MSDRNDRALRRATALSVALVLLGGGSGCATCRPDAPPVEPRVGGAIGGGSSGFWHSLGVTFDVTNIFCTQPKEPTPPADERTQPPADH